MTQQNKTVAPPRPKQNVIDAVEVKEVPTPVKPAAPELDMDKLAKVLDGLQSTLLRIDQNMQQDSNKAATGGSVVKDAAQLTLVQQALNTNRPTGYKFLLVVVPDDSSPMCEEFDDINSMLLRIRQLIGQKCYLFPIIGQRFGLSSGTHKFLSTPYGQFPLFDTTPDSDGETTQTGWVGPPELESVGPDLLAIDHD